MKSNLKLFLVVCICIFGCAKEKSWEEIEKKVYEAYAQGNYQAAAEYSEQILRLKEQEFGRNNPAVFRVLMELGDTYHVIGDLKKAETYFLRALELRTKFPGSRELGLVFQSLGDIYLSQQNYSQAESFCVQSLEIQKKIYGDKSLEAAKALNCIARSYFYQAKFDILEIKYLEILEILKNLPAEKLSVGQNPGPIASVISNLGDLYRAQHRYEDAEANYLQSLAVSEKEFNVSNYAMANTLHNLGQLYEEMGDCGKAMPFYERSLIYYEKNFGKNQAEVAGALKFFIPCYEKLGRLEDAKQTQMRINQILSEAQR